MKITQEVDYALRIVLYLCKLGFGEKIEAKFIAEHENIPIRFLLKILRKLKQSGIVESFRGINGGYALNKYPADISFKDIIISIDGPIYMNRCLYDPKSCNLNRSNRCVVHNALASIQTTLITKLESITFKDLLDEYYKL
ncbi:RrF2 family transcriptional regulator [Clostridium botulinum]|uniref:Transcriptional regulator n=1 Tax=Clostridium botulinum TaxID=1491 RepID=A0A9Q1UXT8_CLOBO|nr:Rrf2 family transcriptional regulator [Clostridium botulinum]AEB77066.1 rrf2 family protein (putative transcriptional regulator) [Clostridium botulinum BKT015925]KEI02052.1 transcriptional regulator [Clostridium botulinum D str. 16868]KEI05849.1 transcriptional regulator [Clostridium botulinum C/D str. Sp77]KLU75451.1 transcriptional regulator [Clostridium botulinum V891]KOA73490.1 transcriptional regulator [Clostridium botulinum]